MANNEREFGEFRRCPKPRNRPSFFDGLAVFNAIDGCEHIERCLGPDQRFARVEHLLHRGAGPVLVGMAWGVWSLVLQGFFGKSRES